MDSFYRVPREWNYSTVVVETVISTRQFFQISGNPVRFAEFTCSFDHLRELSQLRNQILLAQMGKSFRNKLTPFHQLRRGVFRDLPGPGVSILNVENWIVVGLFCQNLKINIQA